MTEERYTPGLWKAEHMGGHAWKIVAMAKKNEMLGIIISSEADARLIAEAPNLFQLVKQGLDLDNNEERQCPCSLCEAGRTIMQRILEG